MAHDHPAPTPLDYRSILEAESARFADLIEGGPLDAPIAGCPGWSLRDLGVHLGDVQRWATGIIASGEASDKEWEPAGTNMADWFRDGTAGLLAAIDASDPEAACWNLWPTANKVTRFWYRRQALEAVMHRWDAEAAVATPAAIDAAVAADVVDEWVHVMLPRAHERDNVDVATLDGDLHFHCTDTAGEWTLDIVDGTLVAVDEHRKSAVAARGPAHDLALLVYNRGSGDGVEIFGDTKLLDRWLGR